MLDAVNIVKEAKTIKQTLCYLHKQEILYEHFNLSYTSLEFYRL